MPRKRRLIMGIFAAFTLFLAVEAQVAPAFAASKEKVLYSFCSVSGCQDGQEPLAGLTFDAAGKLYGTTVYGGAVGVGTIFQLTPGAKGQWIETVLQSFTGDDGFSPNAGVIFDPAGNLYTTAAAGGPESGTAIELVRNSDNTWTEKVLHDFSNGKDGGFPFSGLIFDTAGHLYGTTEFGGKDGCDFDLCGTVFELLPKSNGLWNEKAIHSFTPYGKLGYQPLAGVIRDAAGNLYGSTPSSNGAAGVVFELIRNNGRWTSKVIHTFYVNEREKGLGPYGTLAMDEAGNLFGTTAGGGAYDHGVVFEFVRDKSGKWAEKVLHSFRGGGDGAVPQAGVILDAAGNIYGTTSFGGNPDCTNGCGTVFKLVQNKYGRWTEIALHRFDKEPIDGWLPQAGLVFDAAGNLYGTTAWGGAYNSGTVFEITP